MIVSVLCFSTTINSCVCINYSSSSL